MVLGHETRMHHSSVLSITNSLLPATEPHYLKIAQSPLNLQKYAMLLLESLSRLA